MLKTEYTLHTNKSQQNKQQVIRKYSMKAEGNTVYAYSLICNLWPLLEF